MFNLVAGTFLVQEQVVWSVWRQQRRVAQRPRAEEHGDSALSGRLHPGVLHWPVLTNTPLALLPATAATLAI